MPVRRAIGNYIKVLISLLPIRKTEKKIYFPARCFPASGSSKKSGYVEAISFSGWGAGWGGGPGNQTWV